MGSPCLLYININIISNRMVAGKTACQGFGRSEDGTPFSPPYVAVSVQGIEKAVFLRTSVCVRRPWLNRDKRYVSISAAKITDRQSGMDSVQIFELLPLVIERCSRFDYLSQDTVHPHFFASLQGSPPSKQNTKPLVAECFSMLSCW